MGLDGVGPGVGGLQRFGSRASRLEAGTGDVATTVEEAASADPSSEHVSFTRSAAYDGLVDAGEVSAADLEAAFAAVVSCLAERDVTVDEADFQPEDVMRLAVSAPTDDALAEAETIVDSCERDHLDPVLPVRLRRSVEDG